jgi:ABC-type multidrug transport system permease subunit
MKTTQSIIAISSMSLGFICSYFMELTMQNAEQYLAVTTLVFADGFFGIIAGIKREGFKTYKAIKILRTLVFWTITLTVILVIEKSIPGAGWLSETVVMPLVVLQLISALKNASMAGFIKMDVVNQILDRIDKHKGDRK